MSLRTKSAIRKFVVVLTSLSFVMGIAVMFVGPTETASAQGTSGQDLGVITSQQAGIICNDYQSGPQADSGIKLLGHKLSINQECESGLLPPVSTLAVICRAGYSGIDGQTNSRVESIDPNSPGVVSWSGIQSVGDEIAGLRNLFEGNDQASIVVRLSEAGLKACAADRFCYDWGFGLGVVNCSGSIGPPPPTLPPPPKELNVKHVEDFTSGLVSWALYASVLGILVSAALWALGNKGDNPGTELTGKQGLLVCCAAAFALGALPNYVDWLNDRTKDPNLDRYGVNEPAIPIVRKESSAIPTIPQAEVLSIDQQQLKNKYQSIAIEQRWLVTGSPTWMERQREVGALVRQMRDLKVAVIGPVDKPARIAYVTEEHNALVCGAVVGFPEAATMLRQEMFDLTGNANNGVGNNLCTDPNQAGAPVQALPAGFQQGTAFDNPGNCTEKRRNDPRPCVTDWSPGQLGRYLYADTITQCEDAAAKGIVLPKEDYCISGEGAAVGGQNFPTWADRGDNRAACEASTRQTQRPCVVGWQPGVRGTLATVFRASDESYPGETCDTLRSDDYWQVLANKADPDSPTDPGCVYLN